MPDVEDIHGRPWGFVHETIWASAVDKDAVILLTDFPLARRKRIHIAHRPLTGQQWESTHLGDLLTTVADQLIATVVIIDAAEPELTGPWWLVLMEGYPIPKQ